MSILDHVGNTPIVTIHHKTGDILVKLEEFNPGQNIKTRIAKRMIESAEKKRLIQPHTRSVILESTGGNTGVGLLIAASQKGYATALVIPDNFSKEKIGLLRTLGAEVHISDSSTGSDSHIVMARDLQKKNPHYFYIDQMNNHDNPDAHYYGTGEEIITFFKARSITIDCFVCGIGSGGTITGVSRKIKEYYPNCHIFGVQPEGCDVLKGVSRIGHGIQGISIGVIPKALDPSNIHDVISVSYAESIIAVRELVRNNGLFLGISSGANFAASVKARKIMGKSATILTISPDSGRAYLSEYIASGVF